MKTRDRSQDHLEKIAQLFPNVLTEVRDEQGNLKRAVDFDLLKQELADVLVESAQERYQLSWPGKRQAILMANTPIHKTLRPVKEESVDWETTQNLYIEGDNLEVLKLLQESYLNKVKLIYIDPPYNTGRDFVFRDNFSESTDAYLRASGQVDEEGNRLFQNTESAGRFHSNWLSMIYSRLKLARNLLRDDGVIFISIDDHEVANLRRICDEIFGEQNFIALLPTIMNLKGNNDQFGFAGTHEYTLVFAKNISSMDDFYGLPLSEEEQREYNLKDDKGYYKKGATLMRTGEAGAREKRPKGYYPIYVSKNYTRMSLEPIEPDDIVVYPKTKNGVEMSWRRSKETLANTLDEFMITPTTDGVSFYKKQRLEEDLAMGKKAKTLFYKPSYSSGNGTNQVRDMLGGRYFDNPKPVDLLIDFLRVATREGIVLDFFSGSATMAHAVMQLNAEDGGKRQFIMVQLPEAVDEQSEAYQAGYKNICEIGKERIRRAAHKIREETGAEIDYGFRVFRVDSSNMKDTYYTSDYTSDKSRQMGLAEPISNIKEERTGEDLLVQVMLELGLELSLPMEIDEIEGKTVYRVAANSLMACFEEHLPESVIKQIAAEQPLRVVFRDSLFQDDAARMNVEELFRLLSPNTNIQLL